MLKILARFFVACAAVIFCNFSVVENSQAQGISNIAVSYTGTATAAYNNFDFVGWVPGNYYTGFFYVTAGCYVTQNWGWKWLQHQGFAYPASKWGGGGITSFWARYASHTGGQYAPCRQGLYGEVNVQAYNFNTGRWDRLPGARYF